MAETNNGHKKLASPEARLVAESIADELFTNPEGERADHFDMITEDGRKIGTWTRTAMAQFIARIIDGAKGTGS
jgi:hypothetical protein